MRIGKKSPKREKRAMTVSLYANLFFVVIELIMAIVTSSQAVLLDAVYDGIEFVMLLPSVFLIPLLYQPSNEKYPFGHMQLETVFIVIKGTTMAAVTVGLIMNSVDIILHGGRRISFGTVAWFELFACVLGIIVTLYLRRKNKGLNSPIVEAEMQGWKIDSLISFGMTTRPRSSIRLTIPVAFIFKVPPCVYSLPYGMFTGSSGSEMMLKTVDTALAVEILRFYRDDGCQDQ